MTSLLLLAPDLSANSVYPPWQLMGALQEGGHRARLAGPASGPPWPPLAEGLRGATVLPGRWAGLPGAAEARRAAEGADALYAFKAMPTSLGVALRVRAGLGVPLLLHLDDWDAGFFEGVHPLRRAWRGLRDAGDPRGDLWLRLLERRIGAADALTVSSTALQRRFGGTLLRQGVDVRRYGPERFTREEARDRLGVGAGEPMVLFLGTPRLHKGLAALEALGSLRSAVWIVGGAAQEEAGVPDVLAREGHRVGAVSFDEAAWYLAACDVFVVPQAATPFAHHQLPAKLLHAMALGCAIVATDVGDASALLGGPAPAGLVVPPGDPESLARAVHRLLEDPALSAGVRTEARRRAVASLGWDSMRATLESVLGEVGVHA